MPVCTNCDADLLAILSGHQRTTAQIFYRVPDYKNILQMYLWQEYDVPPRLPKLNGFLAFWRAKLIAPIHSVQVAWATHEVPVEFKHYRNEFTLN